MATTNTTFGVALTDTSALMNNTMADIVAGFGSLFTSAFVAYCNWQKRIEERMHLSALDERLLDDMGITRDGKPTNGRITWMS